MENRLHENNVKITGEAKNSVHVVIEYPLRFIDRDQLFSFYMMPFPINQS
jgi:hypothetical protein